MTEFYARIINKHDIESNWTNSSFTPEKGELIIYDIDDNNVAERLKIGDGTTTINNLPFIIDDNKIINTYTHTTGALSGKGVNGKFKATVSETLTSILINGVDYVVNCGEENSIDLILGKWYTFILDGTTINFKTGGGLSNSKLALATATEADVLSGKTFYAGDKTLKIGTGTDVSGLLYCLGNEFENITGGWTTHKNTGGSITKNAANYYFNVTGIHATFGAALLCTVNPIDLTNFSTLYMNVNGCTSYLDQSGADTCGYFLGVSTTHPYSSSAYTFHHNIGNTTTKSSHKGSSVNVSSLTGEYYVWVGATIGGSGGYYAKGYVSCVGLK